MAKKISTDFPISEITLRRYEKPINNSRRELVKKICLSLGLLQPGDSRDVIIDVLYSLLETQTSPQTPSQSEQLLSSEGIRSWVIGFRKQENLELLGIASSNIRRQIKRLRDALLVEKIANKYRISENLSLHDIFNEKIKTVFLPTILSRIDEYAKAVDLSFRHTGINEDVS